MNIVGCVKTISHSSGRYRIYVNSNNLFHFKFCVQKNNFSLSSLGLFNAEGNTVTVDDGDQHSEEQLRIEKLRNKSRLREDHHNIILNKVPYSEAKAEHHLTIKFNRKMFGKYGLESGVNPGISWPSKADIEKRLEFESVAYPSTIQELVKNAENEIKDRELSVQQTHSRVVANMAKLHLWKKELKEKIAKREAEALAIKEKKEKLVEEVRRHFGFKIDPKDERFKEMLAVKEKEQKKKERQLKIEERERKAIAKLMSKNDVNVQQDHTTKSSEIP